MQTNVVPSAAPQAAEEGAVDSATNQADTPFIAALKPAGEKLLRETPHWSIVREAAFQRLNELGLPGSKDETWKYTSLQEVSRAEFVPAKAAQNLPSAQTLQPYVLPGEDIIRLTFVNGRFVTELSTLELSAHGVTDGIEISTLSSTNSAIAKEHLGRYAQFHLHSFHALNSTFFTDGAFIHLKQKQRLESPIQLLCISTGDQPQALIPLRHLIVAEAESTGRIVETYVGLNNSGYFTSAVTEVYCGQGADIDHTKVQLESEAAFHFASLAPHLEGRCRFASHVFSFGAQLVRNEISPVLNGEQIECFLNGLTVIDADQHTDNTTVIDHAEPNCFSRELYKGIYAGRSSGVFSGTIIVRQDAQKTNAIQSNQSLLLSDEASIDTRPQLKIYADDVKCTHGATIGQLDEQALFYLRSRGIEKSLAKNILIHAYASDIIRYVPLPQLKEQLEGWLMLRLASSE